MITGPIRFLSLGLPTMLALLPVHVSLADANVPDTLPMKAALTFNIAQFVRYPRLEAGDPINLCVTRGDPMEHSLQELRGRQVGASVLRIRTVENSTSAFRGCEIAYLGRTSYVSAETLSRTGVLTIGDSEGVNCQGCVVGLVRFGRQIRFVINSRAADQSGMKISSKLLRLAMRVVE